MQNNIQAFNEGKNSKLSVDFRENFNALLDKRVVDLKKYFHEKKLIHHTTMENKKSRSGYIEISKIFKNYGFVTHEFIEAYSSGEESDMEDEKIQEPSVREVNEKILDYRTIISVKKISNIPKNTRPGIVIINLEEWVTVSILKRFIEEIPILSEERVAPKISDIRILNYKNVIFGLVLLLDNDQARKIYSFFNHPQKLLNHPAKNSKGEKIEVKYAFDLLDMENSGWYGVILRNIPEKCSHENLKNFIGNYSKHINYLLPATKIKNSYCSIVVLDSLEEAEKICKSVNKKEMGKNRFIKAHLHPRTCLMRRNPENSIFKNYYRFDNGDYYKRYNQNYIGNILITIGNDINVASISKYTPINRLLTIILDSKINNSLSGINNQFSSGYYYDETKNKDNEDLKNQKLQEKENSMNNKRLNNSIKDAPINTSSNNILKKSTDFLNFYLDEEEKNKKKQTLDINTSYLTKLIMKPSKTNTNKNEEIKSIKESVTAPTSSVNLFIADIKENKSIKDFKQNKNVNLKREISSKNLNGNIKRFEIGTNKNEDDKEISEERNSEQPNSVEKDKVKTQIIPKISLDVSGENYQSETKNKKKLEEKIHEKSLLLTSNEDKLNQIKENKKDQKQSGKRLEIGPVGNSLISELIINNPPLQGEINRASNSNSTTNLNNTPIATINKNESIISNLSGLLKEMVKSDKEKTIRSQLIETSDFNSNVQPNKNQDKINNDNQSKTENERIENFKDKIEENDEEIIDIKYSFYDSEFFKYDFHDKSYYDKPKNFRTDSKRNKDERSSHFHSKSIFDRSRDVYREKDREREKEKYHPNSKFYEKSLKKYEEGHNQRNIHNDSNNNYYNVNSKISTSSSNLNNYQNTTVISQIKNLNPLSTNLNQTSTSVNKTRLSNFTSAEYKNNANDNHSNQETKNSIPKNTQITSNTLSETPILKSNINNFKNNFAQINNQHVQDNFLNNNNIANDNQQQQIGNKNTSHSNFQSQSLNSIIFPNKPNISTQQSQNTFLQNKISTGQQIPFNPIIQNNPTIINNYINIIPTISTEIAKDINNNKNTTNNINNSQYTNSQSGQSFNNVSFTSGKNPTNVSNLKTIYPKNPNLVNNLNINQNIVTNQNNYSSLANMTQNVLVQNRIMNDKINENQYMRQNELIRKNFDKNNIIQTNANISFSQFSDFEKSNHTTKNEIILPPRDDFIPPLPPENPPEPDTIKFDELEHSSVLDKEYNFHKRENVEVKTEDSCKKVRHFRNSIDQIISLNQTEKTEPGQILNYDSEDSLIPNLNANKPSKRIDVKNAPIYFKKYNFSRSSSSSSHSYKKKDYINKKRDREKIRKYSREREREKDKDKKKKKHRSRSKERNANNNIKNYSNTQGSITKRENKEYKDNFSRNISSKKYDEGNKRFNRQENRSSSSSSSFQSGEEGRYYKRLLERRTNIKKEKK